MENKRRIHSRKASPHLILASAAFIATLILLSLLLLNSQRITRLGFVDNLYYLILVPLGLMAAAALFGILRSIAIYQGSVGHSTLQLGGPVVVFLLVILLGFKLAPAQGTFALTLFVHGSNGVQDIVLRDEGRVFLDLGADRRSEPILSRGQATFTGVPSGFRGSEIPVSVEADGYEVAPGTSLRIEGDSGYIAVRPRVWQLSGHVFDSALKPVAGAAVSAGALRTQSDSTGFFRMSLSGDPKNPVSLQVTADGHAMWQGDAVLSGNEMSIVLDAQGASP